MRDYYVYILTNKTNKVLYIGVTNDLLRRVNEHKQKIVRGFTSKYNVNKLVYYEYADYIWSALEREKQLKNWKRSWKIDLVNSFNSEWRDLYDQLIKEY